MNKCPLWRGVPYLDGPFSMVSLYQTISYIMYFTASVLCVYFSRQPEHPDWSCSVYELDSESLSFFDTDALPLLDLALVHRDAASLQHNRLEIGPVCFAGG
jgi:hypothetical protein